LTAPGIWKTQPERDSAHAFYNKAIHASAIVSASSNAATTETTTMQNNVWDKVITTVLAGQFAPSAHGADRHEQPQQMQ